MASIFKRKDKNGKSTGWRAVVRIKGYPTACKTFDRKQEAEDWAQDTVALIEIVLDEMKKLYRDRSPNKPLVFASKTTFGRVDIKKGWQAALKRAQIEDLRLEGV